MITVACVWVRGNVPYTAQDVSRLAAMVRRHCPMPYRFLCLTDRPEAVAAGIGVVPVQPMASAGWWSKLHLFNPAVGLSGRVLYLDLDTLVVGGLWALADQAGPMVTIADDGSTFQPKDGRAVIKRYNSSAIAFDAGAHDDLWASWTPAVAARLWGDQDWLAECRPHLPTFPAGWCPRISSIGAKGIIPRDARIILAKKPKPADAAARWPWVAEIWTA